tara:strand:- start:1437 stop:2375 length:939 start_codon:yes stop_codon:yes gene_type:complete
MSIRNDAGATPAQTAQSVAMQQALSMHGMPEALQGVGGAQTMAPVDEMGLAEANTFNTNNPEHPLHRTLMVSIRASMNDLCLKKAKATWAPTGEAMKVFTINQTGTRTVDSPTPHPLCVRRTSSSRRSLSTSRAPPSPRATSRCVDAAQGILLSISDPSSHPTPSLPLPPLTLTLLVSQSIVLHKMSISSQKNDFPLAVGMRVSGVDDAQFSVTGEPFSSIALSGANTNTSRTLQEDDVSLGKTRRFFKLDTLSGLLPFPPVFTLRTPCHVRSLRVLPEVSWVRIAPYTLGGSALHPGRGRPSLSLSACLQP